MGQAFVPHHRLHFIKSPLEPENEAPPPTPPTHRRPKAGVDQAFTTNNRKQKALMQPETYEDSKGTQRSNRICST